MPTFNHQNASHDIPKLSDFSGNPPQGCFSLYPRGRHSISMLSSRGLSWPSLSLLKILELSWHYGGNFQSCLFKSLIHTTIIHTFIIFFHNNHSVIKGSHTKIKGPSGSGCMAEKVIHPIVPRQCNDSAMTVQSGSRYMTKS